MGLNQPPQVTLREKCEILESAGLGWQTNCKCKFLT